MDFQSILSPEFRKGGLRIALFLLPPMPFEWSGVASAPDGRHGLPISPVTGITKGRSSDRPFSLPPMPLLSGPASQARQTGGMDF
ncbi:hypothetical protein FLX27_02835 [Agrobacterium tumefaciens]|nr:hypothetical protein FLX27_02835 [Agrobacterium tumefaciens]